MSDPYARIFLLSHMRALTTLAGHILGSHPRINGYFEMHISYADVRALERQREAYLEHETLKEHSHYLFDKLLHNDCRLDTERLGDVDIKLLVSLLAPTRAIKSIVDLFERKGPGEPYADPARAADYYIERLNWLAGFCRSLKRPYYYYDAELFQQAPAPLLEKLTQWLELDTPLSERYQLFSQTGKARKGDSSASIYAGQIRRSGRDYAHIRLPEAALRRAWAVYRECRADIIAHAADSHSVQAGRTVAG